MKEKMSTIMEHIADYAFVTESLVIFTTMIGSLIAYAMYMRGL